MTQTKPRPRQADRFVPDRLFDYSNRALRAELRRVSRLVPPPRPLTTAIFNAHGRVHVTTYRKRFGDWASALRAASLGARIAPRGGHPVRFTEEVCFENLRALWRHHGRQPVQHECYAPPSTVAGYIYGTRFGSWRRAIAAFLAWSKGRRRPRKPARDAGTGSRGIPLRLRYAVLERDGFRCVACGAVPDSRHRINLEIDHKKPRAEGGTTTLDNLQTLCTRCNRGKSDCEGTETMPAKWRSAAAAARPRRVGARKE